MTTVGLNAVAQALNWSACAAQNVNMGSPFSSFLLGQTTNTLDVYGAVGAGATAPAASDVQLTTEIARSIISAGGFSTNQVVWSFFYGVGIATGTINEVGVFVQASSATNNGSLLDHALITPGIVVTSTETATMQAVFQIAQGS